MEEKKAVEEKTEKKILNYFIVTLNGMALGLFSTLIIGVIIRQIGTFTGIDAITQLAAVLMGLMGVGIGVGVAWSLKLTGLPLVAGAVAGGIATQIPLRSDPVIAYITVIVAIEGLRFILRKKTPFDIVLVPLISSFLALVTVLIIQSPVIAMMDAISWYIDSATAYTPFFMGIIIAVLMGMALTAPISSAAIAVSITLGDPGSTASLIAGGAAVVGGATQMIGFAVMSRKDNSIGVVLSVAFGTSMLHFKNILRKPIIWLPPIIASAILGPISTVVFGMNTHFTGSGMGTSALVGQFATFDVMGYSVPNILIVLAMHFVLPIVLVLGIDLFFRHKNWIVEGDFALSEK